MIVERILEAVVIVLAIGTALRLVGLREKEGSSLLAQIRERPVPVTAIVITVLLVVGAFVGEIGSGGWHVLTAPFFQGGPASTLFNIVTAAIVLALAGWFWGQLVAAGVWLLAAWAPVGAVAGLVSYHVSAQNVAAYSYGSSGATYFTAGTLCAALLVAGVGRERLLGLVAPAVGVVMWLATNDGHGVMVVEGAVLGLVLAGVRRLLRPSVGSGPLHRRKDCTR